MEKEREKGEQISNLFFPTSLSHIYGFLLFPLFEPDSDTKCNTHTKLSRIFSMCVKLDTKYIKIIAEIVRMIINIITSSYI